MTEQVVKENSKAQKLLVWYRFGKWMENYCMKQFFLFSLLLIFFSPSLVKAQKGKTLFGGNLIIGTPVGDFRNGYRSVLGVEGLAGFAVASNVYVTGTIGYQSFAADPAYPEIYYNYGNITMIPLKAGVRFYPVQQFFVTGNLGTGLVKDAELLARESRFIYDVGAGLHISKLQASIHYDAIKRVNSPGSSNSIVVKVGIGIR